MPASPRFSKNKSSAKKVARNKPRIIASKPRSRFAGKPLQIVVALLFGATGVYLLAQSGALQPDEVLLPDDPARGLIYDGHKIKTRGPCKGQFDLTPPEEVQKGMSGVMCGHMDPGAPEGQDVRERAKHIETDIQTMADYDATHKPIASGDTSNDESALNVAATINRGSLEGLPARDWPCLGTGTDGARVRLIYVYTSGKTNRLPDKRAGFAAIARRTNNIMYASGLESGNAHQIRFATSSGDPGCGINISAEPISATVMNKNPLDAYYDIQTILKGRGYNDVNRKYLIWVDTYAAIGLGGTLPDTNPSQANINNTQSGTFTTPHGSTLSWNSPVFAMVWNGAWNYGEPHELMHSLGAVQDTAPYTTSEFHCRDNRDIMCYNDGGDTANPQIAPCLRDIDWWRYDCRHDTYYSGANPTSGWLSNHWNTANSRFLTR